MFLFASSSFHLQEYYYDFVCASNHSYIIIPFTVRISKDSTVDHYVEKFDLNFVVGDLGKVDLSAPDPNGVGPLQARHDPRIPKPSGQKP